MALGFCLPSAWPGPHRFRADEGVAGSTRDSFECIAGVPASAHFAPASCFLATACFQGGGAVRRPNGRSFELHQGVLFFGLVETRRDDQSIQQRRVGDARPIGVELNAALLVDPVLAERRRHRMKASLSLRAAVPAGGNVSGSAPATVAARSGGGGGGWVGGYGSVCMRHGAAPRGVIFQFVGHFVWNFHGTSVDSY
jgi:hypothetical protein